ncbi:MAG TPA: hypothetical protein VEL76_12785 [Gemmataceae bacterium]|nr:hypothetical protein [Gemmataceae bacterium]
MTGEILEITFRKNHDQLRGVAQPQSYRTTGHPLRGPEWVKDRVPNDPVAYTMAKTIPLEVKVKVEPAGKGFKLFGINNSSYLKFESEALVSTGVPK